MLDILDEGFKTTVFSMLKELKEKMDKELNKSGKQYMSKIRISTKIIEIIKRRQILELRITVTELKKYIEEFNSRFEKA